MDKIVDWLRLVGVILGVGSMLTCGYLILTKQIDAITFVMAMILLIELCHVAVHAATKKTPTPEPEKEEDNSGE